MSHILYKTEGIILNQREFGEADRLFSFYTRDFGRIEAKAQGIRHLKSKLRYFLYGYAVIRLSFVSTQNGFWRLVDAEEIEIFDSIRTESEKNSSCAKIIDFAERFIKGTIEDIFLWEEMREILSFLDSREMSDEDLKNFEIYAAARVMLRLGYIDDSVEKIDFGSVARNRKLYSDILREAVLHSHL